MDLATLQEYLDENLAKTFHLSFKITNYNTYYVFQEEIWVLKILHCLSKALQGYKK